MDDVIVRVNDYHDHYWGASEQTPVDPIISAIVLTQLDLIVLTQLDLDEVFQFVRLSRKTRNVAFGCVVGIYRKLEKKNKVIDFWWD